VKKSVFLALSFAIVFLLSSCDNPTTMTDITVEPVNPFIGTWVHENGETWVFTDTTLTIITWHGSIWLIGDYTFNTHNIFATPNPEKSQTTQAHHSWPWAMNNDILFLQGVPFTRKSEQAE